MNGIMKIDVSNKLTIRQRAQNSDESLFINGISVYLSNFLNGRVFQYL